MKQLPYLAQIQEHREAILTGTVLAIDPSVGSASSMPAYAIYRAGELVKSGVININISLPLNERLQSLFWQLQNEVNWSELAPVLDSSLILVVEYITKFGRFSVDSLLKGVGAILAAVECKIAIEIPPAAWHRLEPPGYYKTDEQDAIAIGYYAIAKAKGVPDNDRSTTRRSRSRKTASPTNTAILLSLREDAEKRATRSTRPTRKKLAHRGRVRSKPARSKRKKRRSTKRGSLVRSKNRS